MSCIAVVGLSVLKAYIDAGEHNRACQEQEMVVGMSSIPKILIVSNLQTSPTVWVLMTAQHHWEVILETHPDEAFKHWAELMPDLIVCDMDSDDLTIELVTKLRMEAVLPIVLLTSSHSDKFMLNAYQAGADECIIKPINPQILEAKIKAWLRRSWNIPVDMLASLKLGKFYLIPSSRTLEIDGSMRIHLTNLELRLMYYLMGHPGRTITVDELCERLWGYEGRGDTTTLKNVMYRLRRKVEMNPRNPHYLRTVPGIGYRFTSGEVNK